MRQICCCVLAENGSLIQKNPKSSLSCKKSSSNTSCDQCSESSLLQARSLLDLPCGGNGGVNSALHTGIRVKGPRALGRLGRQPLLRAHWTSTRANRCVCVPLGKRNPHQTKNPSPSLRDSRWGQHHVPSNEASAPPGAGWHGDSVTETLCRCEQNHIEVRVPLPVDLQLVPLDCEPSPVLLRLSGFVSGQTLDTRNSPNTEHGSDHRAVLVPLILRSVVLVGHSPPIQGLFPGVLRQPGRRITLLSTTDPQTLGIGCCRHNTSQ